MTPEAKLDWLQTQMKAGRINVEMYEKMAEKCISAALGLDTDVGSVTDPMSMHSFDTVLQGGSSGGPSPSTVRSQKASQKTPKRQAPSESTSSSEDEQDSDEDEQGKKQREDTVASPFAGEPVVAAAKSHVRSSKKVKLAMACCNIARACARRILYAHTIITNTMSSRNRCNYVIIQCLTKQAALNKLNKCMVRMPRYDPGCLGLCVEVLGVLGKFWGSSGVVL